MRQIGRAVSSTGAALVLLTALSANVHAGVAPAAAPSMPSTPTGTVGPPAPTATWPSRCLDPAPPLTGVRASASLVPPNTARGQVIWEPPVEPEDCPAGVVEVEQIAPPGPSGSAPAARGSIGLENLRTLTDYTWRLRYVGATAGPWTSVSVPRVLPLDHCLALPHPRPVTGTATSPTSARLTWGDLGYPDECSGTVTVQNGTTGTTVARVPHTATGTVISGLTPGSTTTWEVTFFRPIGSVTVTQPDDVPPPCTATVRIDASWDGGLIATVDVRNTSSSTLRAWSVDWTPPSAVRIGETWNAKATLSGGTFTATSLPWNGALAPGAGTTFGFAATRTGSPVVPAFTCAGDIRSDAPARSASGGDDGRG